MWARGPCASFAVCCQLSILYHTPSDVVTEAAAYRLRIKQSGKRGEISTASLLNDHNLIWWKRQQSWVAAGRGAPDDVAEIDTDIHYHHHRPALGGRWCGRHGGMEGRSIEHFRSDEATLCDDSLLMR